MTCHSKEPWALVLQKAFIPNYRLVRDDSSSSLIIMIPIRRGLSLSPALNSFHRPESKLLRALSVTIEAGTGTGK